MRWSELHGITSSLRPLPLTHANLSYAYVHNRNNEMVCVRKKLKSSLRPLPLTHVNLSNAYVHNRYNEMVRIVCGEGAHQLRPLPYAVGYAVACVAEAVYAYTAGT